MDHLGEDAELYPLGMLDDDAARGVERHIADCASCAQRVARAQLAAASLAAALASASPSPALERRLRESVRAERAPSQASSRSAIVPLRSNLLRFAVAAAFVLAFLGLGVQTLVLRHRLAGQDVALAAIVHSHFNHVAMTPQSADPVAAKILYARDGSWVYVVADKPAGTLHAIARTALGTTDLGALTPAGETATLLVRPRERILAITLQRIGTTVASAKLAY